MQPHPDLEQAAIFSLSRTGKYLFSFNPVYQLKQHFFQMLKLHKYVFDRI